MSRFRTHWADDQASQITSLENELSECEVERADLYDLVEEAYYLLGKAGFEEAEDDYDAREWISRGRDILGSQ